MRIAPIAVVILGLLVSSSALEPDLPLSPDELVKRVVRTETDAMRAQPSGWMYLLTDDKDGFSTLREVVETRQGTVSRLVCKNHQPLSQLDQQAEYRHLEQLLSNPVEQQRHLKRESKDQARISELIRMLPTGFHFEYLGPAGTLTRLKFYPNPGFHPSSIDARIFHAMTGTVLIDQRRNRLARIAGYFARDVDFGGGILGKVRQGGTVEIVRQDVGRGVWNPVELHVGVKARVLFKSLDVRRNLRFSSFRSIRDGLSIKDGIRLLEQQSAVCAP